jgi:hypothetical protein
MSPQVHPVGQPVSPGGGYSTALIDTESRVTASLVPWLWDVMAKPAGSGPVRLRATLDPLIGVQLLPSGEV